MTTGQHPNTRPAANPEGEEPLPSFTEQMADQLGGVRGMTESSIPVLVFVLCNIVFELRPAVIASVGVALAIATLRLIQRRPIRYAMNGLFGVGIGAWLAWNSGDERDFYLPGILYGIGYGVVLLGSAVVRQPLVGWIWSILAGGGKSEWRQDERMVRTFTWLTVLWGVVWLIKVGVQAALYLAEMGTALGIARLALGYPPYLALLGITFWVVRRMNRTALPATAD